MSELVTLRRTLAIAGFEWLTDVHVDEVALDDDSGPAVQIEQSWNPDSPVEVDDHDGDRCDIVALTWAEWAELRDHVETARQMMPEPVVDAPVVCGMREGSFECCLKAGHGAIGSAGAQTTYGHMSADGVLFFEEVPF